MTAGTARERRGSSSDGSNNELFISVESPSLPRRKTLKGKGKEPAKNSHKRKVRFEDEEESEEHKTEEERSGPVLRSGRLSTKTKKARGAKSIL